MGADLLRSDPFTRGLVARAGEQVGADLERVCLRGPDRELSRTRHLQPLLVCLSLGYGEALGRRGVRPDVVLGHSLGEISALAAAGMVSPETAVDMAVRRGAWMGEAALAAPGGMLAVLSTERERLQTWLDGGFPDGRLVVANDNAPDQFVLSGETDALESAARFIAENRLGSCRRLAVSGPWHSPALGEAQRRWGAWLATIPFHPPRIPVVTNASAAPQTDVEIIRADVVGNLTGRVRWRESLEWLRARSPRAVLEVGPGRVLCGLVRANGFGNETLVVGVSNAQGVEQAADALAPR